tara:strand:+ start:6822 stop:7235 length:414 start_codon:yes stop_codon:yes gene_type:complete
LVTQKSSSAPLLLTLTSIRGCFIQTIGGPERPWLEGLVMMAQELAQDAETGGLPLPTPDMDGDALFKLGLMYSAGQGGCPLDRVSAHMIFNLAAMKGSIEARDYRREMSMEMDREEISEAQRAARRWIDAGTATLAA